MALGEQVQRKYTDAVEFARQAILQCSVPLGYEEDEEEEEEGDEEEVLSDIASR